MADRQTKHLSEEIQESIEAGLGKHEKHQDASLMSPDSTMILLTWITFFLLLAVLRKFAWKPILNGLDQRENRIKKSLDDAKRIEEEMRALAETQQQIISKAETQSKQIIEGARKAAIEASLHIEQKAKNEALILIENAQRQIKEELHNAQAQLRQESAEIAVELASKIIKSNLDKSKNQKLIDQYIKEIA